VQNATGRPFEIRGNLEISWFPWLAVRMGPARLGNPPGVEGPHLAQWRSARMGARLVPLIKGQLIIDRIRFDGLQLRLHRSADGRANWEDLLASRPMPANRPGRPAPQIAGLEMRDSALELRDEQLGIQMNMLDWRLDIGEWHSGAPFPVRTEFMLTRSLEDEQPVGAEMRLTTEVQLGAKAQRLELRDIELESHLRGGTFTGEGIPVDLKMPELVASFSPLTFSVPKLSARVANAQVNGSLTVEQTESGLRARGPAEIEIASVRKLLTDLGVDAPLPRDKEALRTLTMKTDWSFSEAPSH
jgi:AsmA protein